MDIIAEQRRITADDLHWLGGIIDGEGCITFRIRPPSKSNKFAYIVYTPSIYITNTNERLVAECYRIMVGIGLPVFVHTYNQGGHRKPRTNLIIDGYKRSVKAIGLLMPYIRIKRKQARLVLAVYAQRKGREKKPYTDEDLALVEQVRTLNHRGTTPK